MGAAIPAISIGISAVGTAGAIIANNQQQAAARRQTEYANMSIRQQNELMRERMNFAKQQADLSYLQQRALLDGQNTAARIQLEQQRAELDLADKFNRLSLDQARAQASQRTQQLLASAAQTEIQGETATLNQLRDLAAAFAGSEEEGNQVLASLFSRGVQGGTAEQATQTRNIAEQATLQNQLESINAQDRAFGAQSQFIRESANIAQQQSEATFQFLDNQRQLQNQFDNFILSRQPTLLDSEYRRQLQALETNRLTNQASLNLQQTEAIQQAEAQLRSNEARVAANRTSPLSYLTQIGEVGLQAFDLFNQSPSLLQPNQPMMQQQPFSPVPQGRTYIPGQGIQIPKYPAKTPTYVPNSYFPAPTARPPMSINPVNQQLQQQKFGGTVK